MHICSLVLNKCVELKYMEKKGANYINQSCMGVEKVKLLHGPCRVWTVHSYLFSFNLNNNNSYIFLKNK